MDYSNDFSISYDDRAGSCTIRFRCFDTPNSVTLHGVCAPDYESEVVLLDVRKACLRLHRLWSFSLAGSDIARLNEPVASLEVAEETADLIASMKAFNAVEPVFDFTVGAVSYLWKAARRRPDHEELASALKHVGAGNVTVLGNVITKDDPLTRIDVGGAAKGFAADLVADMLRAKRIRSADVDLGGNLYMIGGHPDNRPWRVSVRIPAGVEVDPIIVEVQDRSVVTSGSYERFVEIDGQRYTHIVDARTGWPVTSDVLSATVISESSLQADMLATTALALGSQRIDGLARRHEECDFIVMTESGDVMAWRDGERAVQ